SSMADGMSGAGQAQGVAWLLLWRLLTGLGIGGTLAAINAAAAEVSNRRWRNFAMALMVIGYPLGGIVGGLFVQRLLATATWHEVFLYGAWATTGLLPLVWLLVPESVAFLDRRRPPGALERINRILVRFGHPPVSVLSEASPGAERRSIADLFKPGLVTTTVLITFVYFAHITSFYFIIQWVPKIVVDIGFEPRAAAGVLTWANVGGAVGGAIFGLIATRLGLKGLTVCVLLATSVMIVWFGHGAADLASLKTTLAITGLFTNSDRKIVVDVGFEPRAAAGVLTWANVGGAVGGAIFGLIATRLGLKGLTVCVLLATSVMIVWFGHGAADLASLKTTLAITGLFTN